jgi:hypothetical protein
VITGDVTSFLPCCPYFCRTEMKYSLAIVALVAAALAAPASAVTSAPVTSAPVSAGDQVATLYDVSGTAAQ